MMIASEKLWATVEDPAEEEITETGVPAEVEASAVCDTAVVEADKVVVPKVDKTSPPGLRRSASEALEVAVAVSTCIRL